MEAWLKECNSHKGGGKGTDKRLKTNASTNPLQQLVEDTAALALETKREQRAVHAGMEHVATGPLPPDPCLQAAVESTLAAIGQDPVKEAAATWAALHTGIVTHPPKDAPKEAMNVITHHAKHAEDIEDHVIEARVAPTFDQTELKVTWWVRGWDTVSTALQQILVFLKFRIRHGPPPPTKRERKCADSYARLVGKGKGRSK